jgi:hypothetical protein
LEFGVVVPAKEGKTKKKHQIWPLDSISNSFPQI